MECSGGHTNPPGQRFCGTCGAALAETSFTEATGGPEQRRVGANKQRRAIAAIAAGAALAVVAGSVVLATRGSSTAGDEAASATSTSIFVLTTTTNAYDPVAVEALVQRTMATTTDIDQSKRSLAGNSRLIAGTLSAMERAADELAAVAGELRRNPTILPASVGTKAAGDLERSASLWRTSAECYRGVLAATPFTQDSAACAFPAGQDPMELAIGAAFDLANYSSGGFASIGNAIRTPPP